MLLCFLLSFQRALSYAAGCCHANLLVNGCRFETEFVLLLPTVVVLCSKSARYEVGKGELSLMDFTVLCPKQRVIKSCRIAPKASPVQ